MEEKNIKVIDGYAPIQNVRYMTTYSYPVSSTVRIKNSSHYTLNVADDIVFSMGNPISLKQCDMVMSEIKNWGEFTPYYSLIVRSTENEELYIRPVLTDTDVVISAKNSSTQEEKTICRYNLYKPSEIPSNASFYINIGTINYTPSSQSYIANCTVYAIIGQSGCGFDGVGSLTIQFDTVLSSYQNRLYTVSKTSTRRKL